MGKSVSQILHGAAIERGNRGGGYAIIHHSSWWQGLHRQSGRQYIVHLHVGGRQVAGVAYRDLEYRRAAGEYIGCTSGFGDMDAGDLWGDSDGKRINNGVVLEMLNNNPLGWASPK